MPRSTTHHALGQINDNVYCVSRMRGRPATGSANYTTVYSPSTGMAADAISERGMLEGVVEAVGQATVLLVRDEANANAVGRVSALALRNRINVARP